LQLMHEQIVHGFDVSGEQSHYLLPLSLGTELIENTTAWLVILPSPPRVMFAS
jgi:hypothetical protein